MPAVYPPVGFHFKVEFNLEGRVTESDIRFQEVSGITAELGVEELVEGGENRFSHRLPKKATYNNLILKRGMLTDSRLINWFKEAVENFEFTTADVTVTLLNENHEQLAGWNFIRAWPVKWMIADFNAQQSSVVIETIELAYQYHRRL